MRAAPAEAILAGRMAIPCHLVDVAAVKKTTTYRIRPMGEEEDTVVTSYKEVGDFILVPRQLGLELCATHRIPFEDRTSEGHRILFPKIPTLRDYQEGPVSEIIDEFDREYDVVFRARTAFGKTITALYIAAHFGRTTLIVVDQENLRDQWVEALTNFYGMREEDIGLIQGDSMRYIGKPVTIAMIQTLSRRVIERELADYFGFVIFDEVHITPTPTFHVALGAFSATRRLAISATPDHRKDALRHVLTQSLGNVRVAADAQHDRSAVYFLRHPTVYSWYANISPKIGRLMQEITQDPIRNLMLVDVIKWLYGTGRAILVISTNIDHLDNLRNMLWYDGVPEEDMAMYVGQDSRWTYGPDPTPAKVAPYGHVEEAPYTPVIFGETRKKLSSAEMKKRLASAPITFTTYGKFQKGVDDPRLAGGIDITPRGAASQVHGRIKRGKATHLPLWITIWDENSYRATRWMASRVGDYANDNALIYEWKTDGEVDLWNPRELRNELYEHADKLEGMRNEQDRNGISTLLTQSTVQKHKEQQEKSIVEAIRSAKARYSEGSSRKERPASSNPRTGRRQSAREKAGLPIPSRYRRRPPR